MPLATSEVLGNSSMAGRPAECAVRQFVELVPFRALLDHDRRGRHWIAGQQRHRIVQVVARDFERMPRLSIRRPPSLAAPSIDRLVRNRTTRLTELPGNAPAARASHSLPYPAGLGWT